MKVRIVIGLLAMALAFMQVGCTEEQLNDLELALYYGGFTVTPFPANLEAPWTLMGPDGHKDYVGAQTFTRMQTGSYRIIWKNVPGWVTPPESQPQTVTMGTEKVFTATYTLPTLSSNTFVMGSPPGELGRSADETQHTVTLTNFYRIQGTEVTNAQYGRLAQWAVENGYATINGAGDLIDNLDGSTQLLAQFSDSDSDITWVVNEEELIWDSPNEPVREVSWYGAVAYCDWLSLHLGLDRAYNHATWQANFGNPYGAEGFRLPTEAEWENACRSNTTQAFYAGNITVLGCLFEPVLNNIGWYCWNSSAGPQDVALKNNNSSALFDMSGNIEEWVNDEYGVYPVGPVVNPVGPPFAGNPALRGGDFNDDAEDCRSAARFTAGGAGSTDDDDGFRIARTAP